MRFIKWFRAELNSDELDFQEKKFLLLSLVADFFVLCVFLADIALKENIVEIAALGVTVVIAPVISLTSIRVHRPELGAVIIGNGIIFIMLPLAFFFGGGLNGGGVYWFAFAYLYIGLMVTGMWRHIMLFFLTVLAAFEFYAAFKFPELIHPHPVLMGRKDAVVSVIYVGLAIYIMVWFQNRQFEKENRRAKKEAEKVESVSRAQNLFFSNMSHEIRTPINTIIGLDEMILREDVSDEVAEDAANIQAACKILLHIINDILDMSKFQSGQMKLYPVNYNSGDMLSEIVAMLWIRAKDKGLSFHINISPDIPSGLYGDEVRIKQILLNLLNNSIKYTKEGSVTLSVQCGERNGDIVNIVYSVTDTGIGIRKEHIPHLFTAFNRVDEGDNRYIEGSGLGLSIVKQLVDLMGGTVTINSVYTQGSTFVVTIPQRVVNDEAVGELNIETHHANIKRREYNQKFEAPEAHVLIVDDNETNLLVVTKLLRKTKIKIDTAISGAEALLKTLETKYDVIFMDHLMPEMDGIECRHKIKEQMGGKSREARIVALTANAGEEARKMFEQKGFDGYLEKPVSGGALETELIRLLPKELMQITADDTDIAEESVQWLQTRERKEAVMITTDSVADLPNELVKQYRLGVIAHNVVTEEGRFKDGIEIDTDGALAYIKDRSKSIKTLPPDVNEYERFFAGRLAKANDIVHISVSKDLPDSGYQNAAKAAAAFGNVEIFDSGTLSGGQGFLTIFACHLAEEGKTPEQIIETLNDMKKNVHTSFIVKDMSQLEQAGQVSGKAAGLINALMIRPVLAVKNGRLKIKGFQVGTKEMVWLRYIETTFRKPSSIDRRVLLISYAGVTMHELDEFKKIVEKTIHFDQVFVRKVSPSLAISCGAGTFGLTYLTEV